jgi:hypothetical protein
MLVTPRCLYSTLKGDKSAKHRISRHGVVGTENQIQLTRDIPYHSSVQVTYVQQHRLSGYSSFPVLRSLSILRVTA